MGNAQGIEAEIPQELRSNSEELERKARFLRAWHAKMRPNEESANSYAFILIMRQDKRVKSAGFSFFCDFFPVY